MLRRQANNIKIHIMFSNRCRERVVVVDRDSGSGDIQST